MGVSLTFAGRLRLPRRWALATVTEADADKLPADAVMLVDPAVNGVTMNEALVDDVPIVTLAGTVATPVFVEARVTTTGAAAGAERFTINACCVVPVIARLDGVKVRLPVTCTV